MHVSNKTGGIGELAVQQKFVSLGCIPNKPVIDGCPYDLIVEWDNTFHKIQIKTTEKMVNNAMNWDISQHDKHTKRKKYSSKDVDYFALYCIETGSLCLVPFEDIGIHNFKIRLDSYSGRRQSNMHFESDYKFENYVK